MSLLGFKRRRFDFNIFVTLLQLLVSYGITLLAFHSIRDKHNNTTILIIVPNLNNYIIVYGRVASHRATITNQSG